MVEPLNDWMLSDDDEKLSDNDVIVLILFRFLHVMKLACLVRSQLVIWYFLL